jgi:5-hydroxyisourate hydrolase-like protein (transthyretin family)
VTRVTTHVLDTTTVVSVELELADAEEHCHVPLLLAPFAYSTYRGSRA